jgi:serine/threonine-protein kinase
MTRPRAADVPVPAEKSDAEDILFQFDQAWQKGPPPRIEEFLQNAAARSHLLEELVKIDLECRWRKKSAASSPLTLEDYAKRFPQLGPPGPSLELIGEEYRVRQRWGDRPGHGEYQARFAAHGTKLIETLRHIDRQLVAELARREGPMLVREADPQAEASAWLGGAKNVAKATQASPITAVSDFLETLRQRQLLSPAQIEEVNREGGRQFRDPHALSKELLQRDWLTPYQVNLLLMGRGDELILGPYVILERLGEGGTGQVFKARHQMMKRIVALKVIRKELLSEDEVVLRFQREVQLVSQLTDVNVVRAYDAGPIGGAYCLVMEYVEGIDLGRLVRQQGPLQWEQACDHIRQAALGLQHIHERGLVHRDIKPPNLIVTAMQSTARPSAVPVATVVPDQQVTPAPACAPSHPWGIVKILDLGLARLPRAVSGEATNLITPTRAVMIGTPDYLAPEQALDFHKADIRADIYSLGCSFYFLLTGQPPFPGGTLTEKLLRHQQAEPTPLAQFRHDLPASLISVVRKMLAKRPGHRYQTPAELAQALDQLLANDSSAQTERGPWLRPLHWPRRRLLLIGAIAVLILAVFLAFWSKPSPIGWTTLDPQELRAVSGATLTKQADGSVLASGVLGTTDSYTIVAHTDLRGITALRVELLPHASLPNMGPGRHSTGNPVISEIRLWAAPRNNRSAEKVIRLVNPTADYDQPEYPVARAVDGNPETFWGYSLQKDKPRWGVFETQEPIGFRGGTTLTVILDQNFPAAPVGRFRLSVTNAPRPVRADSRLPELSR